MSRVLGYLTCPKVETQDSVVTPGPRDVLEWHMAARGERIAIIDDEEVMTSVTTILLQRLGYSTVSYTSATRFIDAFEAAPERINLVLTDVVMPGMTGVQLVKTLRESGHDVPILLMTGFNVQSRLELGGTLGRISFLRKPFTVAHLAQSIRRMLSSGR
jgi:FixJ family two-component response regulator